MSYYIAVETVVAVGIVVAEQQEKRIHKQEVAAFDILTVVDADIVALDQLALAHIHKQEVNAFGILAVVDADIVALDQLALVHIHKQEVTAFDILAVAHYHNLVVVLDTPHHS